MWHLSRFGHTECHLQNVVFCNRIIDLKRLRLRPWSDIFFVLVRIVLECGIFTFMTMWRFDYIVNYGNALFDYIILSRNFAIDSLRPCFWWNRFRNPLLKTLISQLLIWCTVAGMTGFALYSKILEAKTIQPRVLKSTPNFCLQWI